MALTKAFSDLVRARAQRDPKFRRGLLREAIDCLLDSDLRAANSLLRDYINATVGFEPLAKRTGIPSKSLMRMFGPRGNPIAANLFDVIKVLQTAEGVVYRAAETRKTRRAA